MLRDCMLRLPFKHRHVSNKFLFAFGGGSGPSRAALLPLFRRLLLFLLLLQEAFLARMLGYLVVGDGEGRLAHDLGLGKTLIDSTHSRFMQHLRRSMSLIEVQTGFYLI